MDPLDTVSIAVGDELSAGVDGLSARSLAVAGPATVCRTVRERCVAKWRELCIISGGRGITKFENPRLKV
jgi:hypothetical protein